VSPSVLDSQHWTWIWCVFCRDQLQSVFALPACANYRPEGLQQ